MPPIWEPHGPTEREVRDKKVFKIVQTPRFAVPMMIARFASQCDPL